MPSPPASWRCPSRPSRDCLTPWTTSNPIKSRSPAGIAIDKGLRLLEMDRLHPSVTVANTYVFV